MLEWLEFILSGCVCVCVCEWQLTGNETERCSQTDHHYEYIYEWCLLLQYKKIHYTSNLSHSAISIFIPNNYYLVCLTGQRLVDTASCQPAETYERAEHQNDDIRLRRLFTLLLLHHHHNYHIYSYHFGIVILRVAIISNAQNVRLQCRHRPTDDASTRRWRGSQRPLPGAHSMDLVDRNRFRKSSTPRLLHFLFENSLINRVTPYVFDSQTFFYQYFAFFC